MRRDVGAQRLAIQVARALDEPLARPWTRACAGGRQERRVHRAAAALEAFYVEARLGRARRAGNADLVDIYEEAIANVGACVAERMTRLKSFLREHGGPAPAELGAVPLPPCPLPLDAGPADADHIKWVKGLGEEDVERGELWLKEIADAVRAKLATATATAPAKNAG